MRITVTCGWLAVLALTAARAASPATDAGHRPGPAASRQVIEQSIAMWRIHGALRGVGRTPEAMAFAPGGRAFTLVLTRGNLTTERNEFQLQLCTIVGDPNDREKIELRREPLVTFSTPHSTAAISSVRWVDAERVAFLGSNDGENAQVYELNVRTRKLQRRTNAETPILSFGLSVNGGAVLFASKTKVDSSDRERARLTGLVPADRETAWTFGGTVEFGPDVDVFLQRKESPSAVKVMTINSGFGAALTAERAFGWGSGVMNISPDGRFAIVAPYFGETVPEHWKGYTSHAVRPYLDVRKDEPGVPPSYALVDLRTNAVKPFDAPAVSVDQLNAAWAPDGKRFFVSGFLPLRAEFPAAADVDRADGGILAIDPATGGINLVKAGKWRIGEVSADGKELRLISGMREADYSGDNAARALEILRMHETAGDWAVRERNAATTSSIHPWSQVGVGRDFIVGHVESVDQAPEIALVSLRHLWSKVVSTLNPQLDAIPRGKVLARESLLTKDYTWPIQIVLPAGYRTGVRYPTVVMVMDSTYSAGYVLDDHVYRAAYPVQALANRGIAVVMAYFPKGAIAPYAQTREREMARQFADAVVAHFTSSGLADPSRIAMTGFSRAGWLMENGIQHSQHHFAAAVGIDNFSGTYLQYILSNCPPSMEELYGGSLPFNGHGQKEWWDEAIGFNPQRLQAPLLKEVHAEDRPATQIAAWDIYAGLRRFNVPAELVYYRSAIHIMRRVPEQLSSAERQVDWLVYWLKDEEDPSPAKAEQYARWHEMRTKWEKEKAAVTKPVQ